MLINGGDFVRVDGQVALEKIIELHSGSGAPTLKLHVQVCEVCACACACACVYLAWDVCSMYYVLEPTE